MYVGKYNNKYSILKALFNLLQEEEFYKWMDNKLNWAITKIILMITVALQNRLNSILDGVTMVPLTPFHSPIPTHTVLTPINH